MAKRLPECLELETFRHSIPVTLTDSQGNRHPYRLREMDGPLLIEWRAFAKERTKYTEDGGFEITDQKEYHATLIHKCLEPVDGSPSMSVSDIYNYGAEAQATLFKYSLILNGMAVEDDMDDEGDDGKN